MSEFAGYGVKLNGKPSGIWPTTLEFAREHAKRKRNSTSLKVEIVQVYTEAGPPIDEVTDDSALKRVLDHAEGLGRKA